MVIEKINITQLSARYDSWFKGDITDKQLIDSVFAYLYGIKPEKAVDESIKEAIKQYHIDRGCCDGTDIKYCPFVEKKVEPPKREAVKKADFKLPV